jgi:hypothetical protein
MARIFTKAENRLNNQATKEPRGDGEEELNRSKRRERRIGTQNNDNVLRDAGIHKESRKGGGQEKTSFTPNFFSALKFPAFLLSGFPYFPNPSASVSIRGSQLVPQSEFRTPHSAFPH